MGDLHGADPEQLQQLGLALRRQIDAIGSVMATVSSALAGTTWHGPARRRFEEDWNGSFRTALTRLNEAFDAAGQDCTLRSQELRRVMGVG